MSRRVTFGAAGVKRRPVPEKRSVSFHVALSERERAELHALAERQGVSVGRLLVESALTGRSPGERDAVAGELAAICRQLTGAARNLNQAVKALHMSGSTVLLDECAAEVRATLNRLAQVRW